MVNEKTHMTLSNKECSAIVDTTEMWLKLLGGVFNANPTTHDQYCDLRYNQIPTLKGKSWYVTNPV